MTLQTNHLFLKGGKETGIHLACVTQAYIDLQNSTTVINEGLNFLKKIRFYQPRCAFTLAPEWKRDFLKKVHPPTLGGAWGVTFRPASGLQRPDLLIKRARLALGNGP